VIVAIDGPAGSGKSSTARAVAQRLGFRHLDSGAFYRALTLAALRAGLPAESWNDLTAGDLDALAVRGVPADTGFRLEIGGRDVSDAIRSPEVNAHVSLMARVPAVREWLLGRLREAGRGVDLVADGRDMGTVVFPAAEVKVFLVADRLTRARRRLLERGATGDDPAAIRAEAERLAERDRIDSGRSVAPLRRAPDAIEIDTTELPFDAQVERICALVAARRGAPAGPGPARDGPPEA
jgi:cytidylate kinase